MRLKEMISAASSDCDGDGLSSRDLYLDLPPWSYHVSEVEMP